jgi:hypothetical protein
MPSMQCYVHGGTCVPRTWGGGSVTRLPPTVSSLSLFSKDESAFMVNPLTAQGVAVVVVAYDIAPKGNE